VEAKRVLDARLECYDTFGSFHGLNGILVDECNLERISAQTTEFGSVSRRVATGEKLPAISIALCMTDGQDGIDLAR